MGGNPSAGSPAAAVFKRLRGMQGKALFAVILKALAAASAMLLQWVVARTYGATGTGLFALMATTTTVIGVIAIWGQDYLVLRNVAGDLAEKRPDLARSHARTSIKISTVGAFVGTAVIFAVAAVYSSLFDQPEMQPILMAAAPVCAGLAIGRVFSFTARASGNLIASQLIDGPITSLVALSLMAIVAIAWTSPPYWLIGAAYGSGYAAALIYALWLGRRAMRPWPSGAPHVASRGLLISGAPLVFAATSPYVADWFIIFISTLYLGADVAGQIRIATLILTVMFTITIAFDAIFSPALAGAFRLGDFSRLRRLYRQYAIGSCILNAPIAIAAIFFPTFLLSLFGSEFIVASRALQIGAAIQFFTIALGPAGTVLVMGHREQLTFVVNALALVVLVATSMIAIPKLGIMGGVLAYAATTLTRKVLSLALARFNMKIALP